MKKLLLTIIILLAVPSISHAVYFDGVDDYVNIGSVNSLHASTSDLTISAWIKPSKVVGLMCIVSNSNAAQAVVPWELELNVTAARFSFGQSGTGSGTVRITNATNLNVDTWYHIVATRKFNSTTNWSAKLYLNGKLDGTGTLGRAGGTNQTVAIGRCGAANAGYFQGIVNDVRIYDRALTDQEVKSLYNGYDTYVNLIVRWILDGNTLPFVPVSSLNRANGQAFNGVRKGALPPRLKLFNNYK